MTKRANDEGGKPRKRPDGRWEARYRHDGRRKSVYAGNGEECAEKMTKVVASKDDPPEFVPTAMTADEASQSPPRYVYPANERQTPLVLCNG